MNEEVVIYADTRESGSNVVSILKKRCTVIEKQLDTGDYLLGGDVAAERKMSDDFLQSIVDGRLFAQLSGMKKFGSPVLIIEGGSLFESKRQIHPNAIRGALASIATDFSMPIIWTRNALETAEMLFALAKREQLERNKSVTIRVKRKFRSTNQMQEYLVCGLPLISCEKAKKLLKHFGSPEKVFSASEDELREVEGIGEKLARKIREVVAKKYEKSILED